jgi:hypothetical protein
MSFEKKTLLYSVRRALSLHALLTLYRSLMSQDYEKHPAVVIRVLYFTLYLHILNNSTGIEGRVLVQLFCKGVEFSLLP